MQSKQVAVVLPYWHHHGRDECESYHLRTQGVHEGGEGPMRKKSQESRRKGEGEGRLSLQT